MRTIAMAAGVILALASTGTVAQSTVKEVLDAGGKALTKAELMALLPGASFSGPTSVGTQLQRNMKADGTYSGNVGTTYGKNAPQMGEWKVEDDGQLCITGTTQFRESSRSDKSCGLVYKLGDKYFVAGQDSGPGAPVLERSITK